ncbi:CRISPR-associated helicase Cas3' [Nocardia sp. NPDC004654]|uniref:CRISPR-associated helicase Cas3' n=1 Tax=Nocardia sp. NPDC004654 TaxID=3154776 RepID=UPI0033A1DA57
MAEFWAHSKNFQQRRHELGVHLRGTAGRARAFAEVFGAGALAFYLGLVHDVGKATRAWQVGLLRAEATNSRVLGVDGRGIDHKRAGTWLAARQAKLGVFAMVVWGHHGGLRDKQVLKDAVTQAERSNSAAMKEAVGNVVALVPEIEGVLPVVLPDWLTRDADGEAVELMVRMVFSAVVDADVIDTREHRTGQAPVEVQPLSSLVESFEANRSRYLAEQLRQWGSSPVDEVRARVYAQAVAAGSGAGEPGIYPFAAPTGAGKTIAAAGFGVYHARRRGLRRMIVAVPLTSITEQNAKVYRSLFGAENVLEHHSSVDVDGMADDRRRQHRLAVENWDAPVVVTTTVQLFESLFDCRPAAMRKLHRLAGAVIVLDEVQALPDAMLMPILTVLRHLVECFDTSVVLASATQPEYFALDIFRDVPAAPLITEPQQLFDELRRVRFEWRCRPKPSFAEIAEESADLRQVLLIVNTTRDAARLHRELSAVRGCGGPVLHLSTRMAGAHRRKVLKRINLRLRLGRAVAVVSTQLVEAGVDVDFPVVYRALAPAEALLQAAGRCNRHGVRSEGRVVVFEPADGDIRAAQLIYGSALDITRTQFGPGRELDQLDAMSRYYKTRYAVDGIENSTTAVRIRQLRREFNFTKVAELFTMIEERTVSVVVPYGDPAERRELLEELLAEGPVDPSVYRRLQPYTASLPRRLAARAVADGLTRVLVGDLYEWLGDYHRDRGIDYGTGDFIF